MQVNEFYGKMIWIPMSRTYYCDNHYTTHNLEDAKAHGYGAGGNRCHSFSHDLSQIDYDPIPLINNFSLKLMDGPYGDRLAYLSDERIMFFHPFDKVSYFIKECEERFEGTIDSPYEFLDQGENFKIYDYGDYTYIISCVDIDAPMATAYKVKKEEYYTALCDVYEQIGIE